MSIRSAGNKYLLPHIPGIQIASGIIGARNDGALLTFVIVRYLFSSEANRPGYSNPLCFV
jgi:hypothetical protein